MKMYTVNQYSNENDFHMRIVLPNNDKNRFFTVKLLKNRMSGEYEGTTCFEITGEVTDREIEFEISNFLDPKYGHIGLYQIFEIIHRNIE